MWEPWGLFDEEQQFLGIGRFDAQPREARTPSDIVVDHVRADATRRIVIAEIGGGEVLRDVVLGLLLVDDRTGRPLPLDYTARTEVRTTDGIPTELRLEIPLGTDLGRPVDVWVMADLGVIWKGPITVGPGSARTSAADPATAPGPEAPPSDDPAHPAT